MILSHYYQYGHHDPISGIGHWTTLDMCGDVTICVVTSRFTMDHREGFASLQPLVKC